MVCHYSVKLWIENGGGKWYVNGGCELYNVLQMVDVYNMTKVLQ